MTVENRRELKTRQKAWVKRLTNILVKTSITPNQISIFSVIFAALSGLSYYLFSQSFSVFFLFFAIVFLQLRLLCNMMDGLVAVEGKKGTLSGELFNDIPDRFGDIFILLGAGYAVATDIDVALGWITAVLAVMTAYIRVLGGSLGAPMSFMGPMAKQHRMGALTGITVLAIIETLVWESHITLWIGLVIIAMGTLWTCYRRTAAIYHFLESEQPNKQ